MRQRDLCKNCGKEIEKWDPEGWLHRPGYTRLCDLQKKAEPRGIVFML